MTRNKPDPFALWRFDEGHGGVTRESVSGREDAIHYSLSKGRYGPPVPPRWGRGIRGQALDFDGYSSWIGRSGAEIKQPGEALTITAWIAPRTYDYGAENRLSAIVNRHDREQRQGYVFGIFKYGSWSLQLGLEGEWAEIWSYDHPVPLGRWSFVAAVFDGVEGTMKLYLNGAEAASRRVKPAAIAPAGGDLLIGRNNQGMVVAESFIMNHFSGWMDELALYDRALGPEHIAELYEDALRPYGGEIPELEPEEWGQVRQLRTGDRHRPLYHLSPPSHWMNEPHAPIYFNGQYHLFYQYNPQGPFWHYIHWGHWVSDDLVHWRDLPPALCPEADLDPEGVWSGSACLDEEGYPALFFTAGNNAWKPNQAVGVARSTYPSDGDNDLVRWVKAQKPIVTQEEDEDWLPEFRDPFVWKDGDHWFMLVGTGIRGKGGTAAVYRSSDCIEWECQGCLYQSDFGKYPQLGTAWELPVLLPLPQAGKDSGKHILLISPWGPGAKVEVVYWIGRWDPLHGRFEPDDEEPSLIDVGDFHFTGPSGMVDPKTGRSLLFTIAQGERTPEIDYDCGWAHGGGLPVSLSLREDGRLGIEPIEEVTRLRGAKLYEARGKNISEINAELAGEGVQGDMLEINVSFDYTEARKYGLSVRRTPEGEEETVLYYDREADMLMVNREKATLDARERTSGIQGGSLGLPQGENLRLRVFVDRSLIEGYANGVRSLTTRAYPSRSDAVGIRLWTDGPACEASLEIWAMKPAY